MVNFKKPVIFFFLPLFFLALLITITYWLLPNTYFQQDEWMTFTEYLYSKNNNGLIDYPFRAFRSTGHAHMIPFSLIRSYIQISTFKLQFEPYALLSIAHLIVNSFLIFFLAMTLLKKRILSFVVALLFSVNSIGSQAVTWMAATINTQGAVTFVLLSFIFFFRFLKTPEKKYYFIFSLIFIVIGMLFKETAFVGVISLLFFIFLFRDKKKNLFKRTVLFILFIIVFYLLLRVPLIFLSNESFEKKPIMPWEETTMATYAYRGVTYPLKIISQSIIPYPLISSISNQLVVVGYPHQFVSVNNEANPYIRESIAFDLVSYIISLIIIISIFLLFKFSRISKTYKKIILSFLIFTALSSIPYIFLPGRPGYLTIYDPRSLYMPIIGIAFIEAILILICINLFIKKEKLAYGIILFFAFLISLYHFKTIHDNLESLKEVGQLRKSILLETQNLFPQIPEKVIFYSESDKEYYGQIDKILPFQSGFGQSLLISYAFKSSNFPGCFFEDNFLYALELKGKYKECEGRGFGYFRDYRSMLDVIKKENFNIENINAISWNSFEQKITNISKITQERITSDLKNK